MASWLSQLNTRHQSKIIKSINTRWNISSLKNIEFTKAPWKEIGVQLHNISTDKIFKLFSEYDPYILSVNNRNIRAIKERKASSDRFIKYVFTHSQSVCPLDKGVGCFFVVSPTNKNNWICTSCRTITNRKKIDVAIKKMKPDVQPLNFFNFVKKYLEQAK